MRLRLALVAVAALTCVGAAACGAGAPQDQGLLAEVSISPGSGCPGAEALDSLLALTGVASDHEPTDGPRQLALGADAVLRGRLTGRVEPVRGQGGPAVDLGLDLDDLVLGEELQGMEPPLSDLRVPVAPGRLPDGAATVGALAGLDVVAFVTVVTSEPGTEPDVAAVPAAMEGLMASCGSEGLLGWTGQGDGWDLVTLDQVGAAAFGLPEDVADLEGRFGRAGGDGRALQVYGGPEHCGWESAVLAEETGSGRVFLRDPEGAVTTELVGSLDLSAPAVAPGPGSVWERDASRVRFVLVDGEDGLAVDLGDGRWERWPEMVPVGACA